jgi:hypothetical protein
MPPASTLLWGTANPEGLADSYQGIYLSGRDIKDMVEQVNSANRRGESIPVHIEHCGVGVGRVVSAWEHNNTLQCVLELNERVLEGSIGSEFVRNGVAKDLSLGYSVEMENSKEGIRARNKTLKEISVVKTGARHKCHIHGFSKT